MRTGPQLTKWQNGRPFIIVREQGKKVRTHGLEAIRVSVISFCALFKLTGIQSHILAARAGQLAFIRLMAHKLMIQ